MDTWVLKVMDAEDFIKALVTVFKLTEMSRTVFNGQSLATLRKVPKQEQPQQQQQPVLQKKSSLSNLLDDQLELGDQFEARDRLQAKRKSSDFEQKRKEKTMAIQANFEENTINR